MEYTFLPILEIALAIASIDIIQLIGQKKGRPKSGSQT
jgi:hypothetical protein